MLRKIFILLGISLFFILSIVTEAQNDGWRTGEMEIKVNLTPENISSFENLKVNGDVYPDGTALLYVTPQELKRLEESEIEYSIEKKDLNSYFSGFWDTREEYHTYQEIIDLADSLADNFSSICQKYVFGYSIEGRQLAALKISDNVETDEAEAEVLLDGGIHGDEIGGPENIIRYARDLCLAYGTDPYLTDLIDNREIWLFLMINPDGREAMTRYNMNGVDLNRDWGYMWDAWGGSPGAYSQVENKVVRDFMFSNQFAIQVTYHSGVEMAIYPWGYTYNNPLDEPHLDFLTTLYADVSGYDNLDHYQATTLYPAYGTTQDALLGSNGSSGMTMELSSNKQPPSSQLMYYYNINVPSMNAMLEQAGYGVEGMVTDASTGNPIQALVYVENFYPCFTDPEVGDYHKYALPGTYSVTAWANGYETQTLQNIVVPENGIGIANFMLQQSGGQYAFKVVSCRVPGGNEADEAFTPGALGLPDNISYSLGQNGWIILDMQNTFWDGPGNDIFIYEGSDSDEGYSCYASLEIGGPWSYIGDGVGTAELDLENGFLAEARYLKIVDDGDGSSTGNDAGFDLDAIKVTDVVSGIYVIVTDYNINDENGNNNSRIDAGETVELDITIRNNGDTDVNNLTGVLSTEMNFITIDNESFNFGNLSQGDVAEGTFTISASSLTPAGSVLTLTLVLEDESGSYTKQVNIDLVVGAIAEDWETGDLSSFDWQLSGNPPWFITSNAPFEGTYCLRSGQIGNQQSTSVFIVQQVLANGEISFYRKVSSEAGYDFLEFYIDDMLMDRWSGEMDWEKMTYQVTTGEHSFEWKYVKDYYVTGGSDCGWIDLIVFPAIELTGLGTLSGTVTDITTGNPVENAWIGGVIQTDASGDYNLELSPGTYDVCVYHEAYETLCQEAVITSEETTQLDFELYPSTGVQNKLNSNSIIAVPNPFNSKISFEIPKDYDEVTGCKIFSVDGSQVVDLSSLVIDLKNTRRLTWDGRDENGDVLTNGIYFCIISTYHSKEIIKLLKF